MKGTPMSIQKSTETNSHDAAFGWAGVVKHTPAVISSKKKHPIACALIQRDVKVTLRATERGSVKPSRVGRCLSQVLEGFRYGPSCFHDVFSRPRVERPEDRAQLSSEGRWRIFHSDRHFREHLPLNQTIALQFSQLLRKHLLRDPRHV